MQIGSEIRHIFSHHQTASYVGKIREIHFLSPDILLLRAVAGMVPPGKKDINPEVNAIQSLIAIKENNAWRISLFQNTPAQFHGRPELAEVLTRELQELAEKYLIPTFKSQHISVSINRPADQVYEFASNPENLPKWASELSGSIKNVNGDWIAESPMGRVKIKFSDKNKFGVLNHVVTLPSG